MSESELERNKAIMRYQIEEIWNKRNPAIMDKYFADDYVNHTFAGQQSFAELKQWVIDTLPTLPPDTQVTIEDQIAEGDMVLTRSTWHFTHSVPIPDVPFPPTGKSWEMHALDLHRLRDGKLVEAWTLNDLSEVIQAMKAEAQK